MDFSSLSGPLGRLTLPGQPFSPWLRLAHVSGSDAPGSGRAVLRRLLDFEFVLALEGGTWIYAQPFGGSVDIRAGQVAFLPPGFVHAWANEPGYHMAVHFDLHAHPGMGPREHIVGVEGVVSRAPLEQMPHFELLTAAGETLFGLPLVTTVRSPMAWRERFDPLVEAYSRRLQDTPAAQLRACEAIAWALRTLAQDGSGDAATQSNPADARILKLLRDLADPGIRGLGARPSVDDLAARAGMGLTAFRAAFRQATGRGPREYLEERRIERAARLLLETDLPVQAVAQQEGYDDPYHFSRSFKRVMGVSPRTHRKSRK